MAVRSEPRLLIAEDEDRLRRLLEMLLGNKGYHLTLCRDGAEAWQTFSSGEVFDLVITDLRMPNMDGMALLRSIKEKSPETPVVVITAFGSIENAVEAMRAGAIDYVTKPFEEQVINLAIERALKFGEILDENRTLRQEIQDRLNLNHMIAESAPMRRVLDLVRQVGPTNTTVVLYGESGTGKELIARAIHEASPRSHAPYIAINCAALPENLLESELFGHEKGSFTGATEKKTGKFEAAHGGTMFLDEIGEMSPAIQAKVLRAIELQEFERVGGTKTIKADIRFLAATNRDLRRRVAEGTFRADLLFRLEVFPIVLPALRERPDDILPLARFFAQKFAREMGKKVNVTIGAEAREVLLRHSWPGNVRELQNTIERAMILLQGDELSVAELGIGGASSGFGSWNGTSSLLERGAADGLLQGRGNRGSEGDKYEYRIPPAGFSLEKHEQELLMQALERSGHNKSQAAKLLGISRSTLRYRLEKFGLKDAEAE